LHFKNKNNQQAVVHSDELLKKIFEPKKQEMFREEREIYEIVSKFILFSQKVRDFNVVLVINS
jgi:hypothetical protein